MKITCEYCGAVFDYTDENKLCPVCGAELKNNKTVKTHQEYQTRKEELDIEYKKKRIENAIIERNNQNRTSAEEIRTTKFFRRIFPLFFFGIIIATVAIFALVAGIIKGATNTTKSVVSSMVENIPEKQTFEKQYIVFKETATVDDISVICDEVRDYQKKWYENQYYNGEYKSFHFYVKNEGNIAKRMPKVSCSYRKENNTDWFDAENIAPNDNERKTKLSTSYLSNGKATEGYLSFAIPSDATEIMIQFGDYIFINLTHDDVFS